MPSEVNDEVRLAALRDLAVLDTNLRGGRSFALARDLKQAGLPFVFVTGYDCEVIPDEFDGITRLQKPVGFREIISELAVALGGAH